MVKTALLLFICTLASVALGAEATGSQPILTVDPHGHKGLIRDLVVSSDNRFLISASDDSTIRVWNIKTRKEERKILGQVGAGCGEIYAIALSPDDRWLAVGGYFLPDDVIRIYEFATGKLQHILKSHANVVNDLAFSPDGSLLVSASADSTVKVWDAAAGFQLRDTLKGHKSQVNGVAILPDASIVSTGYDKQVILWQDGKPETLYRYSHGLKFIAVSREWLAVSGNGDDNQILIFDHTLKLRKTLTSKTRPTGLAFSHNGNLLLAGTGAYPWVCNIYDSRNSFRIKDSFILHDNLTMAVTFLDDDTAVTGGGSNNEIYFWKNGRELGHIAGQGRSIWGVALDQNGLHWGNSYLSLPWEHSNPLEQTFDVAAFDLVPFTGNPERLKNKYQDWSLEHRPGGDYGYQNGTLVINKNGSEQAVITRDNATGYRHTSYGFTEDGLVLSAGMNGFLSAYDRNGREMARFTGHTGEVWSIAVHKNRLLSGSNDQTLKLWNLDELRSGKKKIYPMLSLFVGTDGEWVAWSKTGYYTASTQGDKYVGFHVNNGVDHAAWFYPASRFQASLYRPDIVKYVLKTGSETQAIELAGKTRRTEKMAPGTILPPAIELLQPVDRVYQVEGDTLHLECLVIPHSKHEITDIQVLVNGRPLADARGLRVKLKQSNAIRFRRDIDLPLKDNIITVQARTAYSNSNPLILEISKKESGQELFKPTLYLLAIGVSQYRNPDINLSFAADDALAIEELFKRQGKGLYGTIKTRVLTNEQATKNDVLDGLDWLEKETTQRDVAVIFIAGHGLNEKGNYYFLSHDTNPKQLRRSAVNWRDFRDIISYLPSKVLLLADTCHSGAILGQGRRALGANSITQAVKELIEAGSGQVIMTAATGASYSFERPEWGHGAFTKALLEGLGGGKKGLQADYDKDRVVTIKELDLYVTKRVKQLTEGRQKPTTIIPDSVPDFPVISD